MQSYNGKIRKFLYFFPTATSPARKFRCPGVGVVVAKLRIAKFVPRQKHRRSAAAQQHRTGIFDHSFPKRFYSGVVGFSLVPTVPAPVIICTISIIPAVFLVMFFIIRIQVVQRKAVVTGQKID